MVTDSPNFLLLFLLMISFSSMVMQILSLNIRMDRSAVRSLVFETVRLDQKLMGAQSSIEILRVPSQTVCAMACNQNPICLSFNFCNRQTCELNGVDIFSTVEGETLLVNVTGCKYVGFKKTERPLCDEMRIQKNIQDDTIPGICKINKKRVDRQWGPGEPLDLDTDRGWKQVEGKRLLLEAAHGGVMSQQPLGRTIQEYIFVKQELGWFDAKIHCQNLGGSLFHDLDGTTEQLDKFMTRLEPGRYWLGFERAPPNSENWKNVDGVQARLVK